MLPGINSMFLLEVTQGIEPSESKLNLMTQNIKPAAHGRKELSKMPREAFSSAVSSRVR